MVERPEAAAVGPVGVGAGVDQGPDRAGPAALGGDVQQPPLPDGVLGRVRQLARDVRARVRLGSVILISDSDP